MSTTPTHPLDWRSRTRFWCGRFPVVDVAWAALFALSTLIASTSVVQFGPLRWYVLDVLIHGGITLAALVRKLYIQAATLASTALFSCYLVLVALTPVNLGLSPILLAAPLTLWTVTRWGSGAIIYALIAGAGAVLNPAVLAPPILGGFQPYRIWMFGLPAVLVVIGCYALAQQQRSMAFARYHDVLNALMTQRVELARELHDVVGHGLTAIKVSAQTARYLHAPAPALDQIIDMADHSLADVRALVDALSGEEPPCTDPAEIPVIIRRSGVAAELPEDLSPAKAWPLRYRLLLVRAVQELCTNALKHGSSPGRLRLTLQTEGFVLKANNPVGQPGEGGGTGLHALEDRLAGLGSLSYYVTDGVFHIEVSVP